MSDIIALCSVPAEDGVLLHFYQCRVCKIVDICTGNDKPECECD